jgi:signal peptidase I
MSMPAASATEGPDGSSLFGLLSARRTLEEARRLRRLSLLDLLSSLWAPVTAIALALVPYLLVVELHPPSASWALPAMRFLGLLCVVWFFGLLVFRLAARRASRLRQLRHEAREATAEVDAALRGRGAKIEPRAKDRVVELAAKVDTAILGGDADTLAKSIQALVEAGAALPGRRHGTQDLVVGLAKALLVALLIRTVLVEPFKIPSGSMLPTLEIGDQIFVNKFIYGVHIPYANVVVPFGLVRNPERGDVIVFNNPADTSKDFIKRVVGLPGDVVEIRDDVVYVNGREQQRTLQSPEFPVWEERSQASNWLQSIFENNWVTEMDQLYEENLSGHLHDTLRRTDVPRSFETGPYRVPEKSLFVMGDNRDNSADSRLGFGGPVRPMYVPYGNIKGKAMIVWLCLGHGGLFSGLFGGTGIRTDRFFHPVR